MQSDEQYEMEKKDRKNKNDILRPRLQNYLLEALDQFGKHIIIYQITDFCIKKDKQNTNSLKIDSY